MSEELYRAIFSRRSVRRYEQGGLDAETLKRVTDLATSMRPLCPGIRTEIRLMGPDDVRGMFKVAAPHYLAIYSERKQGFDANAGFLLQQADLFFSSIGLGSCWQGGPKPVRGMRQHSGLDFVIMLAFGRPAEPARRERAEFKRRALTEISSVTGEPEVLEAARLAPSGLNNQSWYFTGGDGVIHAYAARSAVTNEMNRINVGIALAHIWLAAEHEGRNADFLIDEEADRNAPRGYAYVATAKLGAREG